MLSFIPHSRAGEFELIGPYEAVMALAVARVGNEALVTPLPEGSPRLGELNAVLLGLQEYLHQRALAGWLTVLAQPSDTEALYRVPAEHWSQSGAQALVGGFGDTLFSLGVSDVPHRFRDSPLFYIKAEIERLVADKESLARVVPSVPLAGCKIVRRGPDPDKGFSILCRLFLHYEGKLSDMSSDKERWRFLQDVWPQHANKLGREKCFSYQPVATAWGRFARGERP